MSNKKKLKAKKKKPRTAPLFPVAAKIRVKHGTADPDFPDVPLGGWAGVVQEVDGRSRPPSYLIAWNQHTLNHMHPAYRKPCERDGFELERMRLSEKDIELDTGEAAVIEQPTEIRTPSLNENDEDDRVRMALGLTCDDPLPGVEKETLQAYRAYLAAHLTFPFEATYAKESGFSTRSYRITITSLGDADDDARVDDMCGLICRAKRERRGIDAPLAECDANKGSPNQQLLKDYSYWFWNYR